MQLLHKMLTAGTKSVERSVVCALNNPVVFIFRHVVISSLRSCFASARVLLAAYVVKLAVVCVNVTMAVLLRAHSQLRRQVRQ